MKREQINLVKNAIRNKYAWPGGYALFGVTSDGSQLCVDCMKDNFTSILWSIKNSCDDGWKISGIDCSVNLESEEYLRDTLGDSLTLDLCAHCNKILNS